MGTGLPGGEGADQGAGVALHAVAHDPPRAAHCRCLPLVFPLLHHGQLRSAHFHPGPGWTPPPLPAAVETHVACCMSQGRWGSIRKSCGLCAILPSVASPKSYQPMRDLAMYFTTPPACLFSSCAAKDAGVMTHMCFEPRCCLQGSMTA